MTNKYKSIALGTLCAGAILLNTGSLNTSYAKKGDNQGHCATDPFTKVESAPFTATAPEGYIISKLFVKAGSEQSGAGCFEYTANTNDGCYNVEGLGTQTATVTKIGSGSGCKDISHVEFIAGVANTGGPDVPGDNDDPEQPDEPENEEDNGNNDTDTDSNNASSSNNDSSTQEQSTEQEKQGEILGAGALADTGAIDAYALAQSLGLISLGLGLAYGKKENK